jgi:hypothetical protein
LRSQELRNGSQCTSKDSATPELLQLLSLLFGNRHVLFSVSFSNDMKKILLLLAVIFGVALLGQPKAQAGVFIGLPIPLPVPVFYGPAYYPGGYYYGPRGYAYYPRPYWRHRAWFHGHWRYN